MKLIVANWKMNLDRSKTRQLLLDIESLNITENNEVVVCPSTAYIEMTDSILRKSTIKLGAQNCAAEISGAFTGETSVLSLAEYNCGYCIIGHSERRTQCGESNSTVAKKAQLCMENHIIPIICIGESAQENASSLTQDILHQQIQESIPQNAHNFIIAYEPIWAIGTGKTATHSELSQIYNFLSIELPGIKILYGGSVDIENAHEIATINGVGGLLIGGASMESKKFSHICKIKY